MRLFLPLSLLLLPMPAGAQALTPGRWDVVSTVSEFTMPGVPGFLQRMARGRSSTEHKLLAAGQGADALLVPDPKAHCTVDEQRIAEGRYTQTLTCPQKGGTPMHIVRTGTIDGTGFSGQATVTSVTPRGATRIVLAQKTVHVSS